MAGRYAAEEQMMPGGWLGVTLAAPEQQRQTLVSFETEAVHVAVDGGAGGGDMVLGTPPAVSPNRQRFFARPTSPRARVATTPPRRGHPPVPPTAAAGAATRAGPQRARTPERPTSRGRRQRLLNELLLVPRGMPPLSEEEIKELTDNTTPSCFRELLEDPAAMRRLQPFIDTDLDAQQQMLDALRPPPRAGRPQPSTAASSPRRMYARIEPKIQRLLDRLPAHKVGFVERVEAELAASLAGDDGGEVELPMALDGYHRLVAHGVCQFYGFRSQGKDVEGGARVLTYRRTPHTSTPHVAVPHSAFLSTLLHANA